jgi:hypothetical protein
VVEVVLVILAHQVSTLVLEDQVVGVVEIFQRQVPQDQELLAREILEVVQQMVLRRVLVVVVQAAQAVIHLPRQTLALVVQEVLDHHHQFLVLH